MYQTARMLETTLSRTALPVCITRLAMRPAKSFWKNGQLCRTTCQWLCQRIRLVAPGNDGVVAHEAVGEQRERAADEHDERHADEQRQRVAKRREAIGRLHERDEAADEDGDRGVDHRDDDPGDEHRGVEAAGLADEVPVEGEEAGGVGCPGRGWDGCGIRRRRTWASAAARPDYPNGATGIRAAYGGARRAARD
jgi:hypothetical protein